MIDEQEKSQPIFEEIQRTGEFNDGMAELLDGFLKYIAKDVLHQNKRLGGRMAVAHAVFSRKQRDSMRKILGPECVFIVLNMSRECQKKRVLARHGSQGGPLDDSFLNMLIKFAEMYEPAGEDEENAYNVTITEDMDREDVIEKILEIVDNLDVKNMTKEEKYMPWKNGYWYSKGSTSWIMILQGDVQDMKSLCSLDYPGAKSLQSATWTYATTEDEFGIAVEEVANASGAEYNNVKIDYDMGESQFSMHGVLNDDGTKFYMRG